MKDTRSKNVILVGIIPGPKQPKENINSYLSHFVEELKEFWHGIDIALPCSPTRRALVKVALTGMSCDLPAVRKVCGFPGHSASLGCSKCLYCYKSGLFGEKLDYSGFDTTEWPARTLDAHRKGATKYEQAQTKSDQHKVFSEYGVRHSILLRLPYFDPIRFHVIDPMHNLLLGTAKHMMVL